MVKDGQTHKKWKLGESTGNRNRPLRIKIVDHKRIVHKIFKEIRHA